jgi:hypothetical protein
MKARGLVVLMGWLVLATAEMILRGSLKILLQTGPIGALRSGASGLNCRARFGFHGVPF